MGTPVYSLRLPEETQANVEVMAKLYGASSPRSFLRELIVATCSGDQRVAEAFQAKLSEKLTGQMMLDMKERAERILEEKDAHLAAVLKPSAVPKKSTPKRKVRGKGRKAR